MKIVQQLQDSTFSRFNVFSILKSLNPAILLLFAIIVLSCREDEENKPEQEKPVIEFAQTEYFVKTGERATLVAIVENAINPVFSWELNNVVISTGLECLFNENNVGEYFIDFRVEAKNGSAERQLKVTVLDKVLPFIDMDSLVVAFAGVRKEIKANVLHAENAVYEWRRNDVIISETDLCIIDGATVGTQSLTLKVTNDDGYTVKQFLLNVLPKPAPAMFFDDGRYRLTNDNRTACMSVPLGKSLVLAPVICNFNSDEAIFQWDVDNVAQSSTSEFFTFSPNAKGKYRIKVTTTVSAQVCVAEADIECVEPEGTYFRTATTGNKAKAVTAFEYIPSPGQFINYQAGSTAENARAELQNLLDANTNSWISLGSFGGYYIAGFDHSVRNVENKADIMINGNAFAGSSEPGIVWVMQDENGNGLPDDTWYELAGSDSESAETKRRYALTYYKPDKAGRSIRWVDNLMNTGTVAINGYHTQQSYFPMFIESDYVLCGTCLKSNVEFGDIVYLGGFAWGYVDNFGNGSRPNNEFRIEDAMQTDGSPANLKHIDFVKVYTAMNAAAGNLGEISCETGAPVDMNF
ncbi:MAG: hypothetical protein LBT50_03125 [Prevotellaceae bacterium]|jgi:hypothetical protein|nr:hypothetical protein [Prevotellaceae bacterium]